MLKKQTMKSQVLEFIKASGKIGRRFGEIQRFIVEDLHGYDYDQMEQSYGEGFIDWDPVAKRGVWKGTYIKVRKYRGYWCTNLLGSIYSKPGILPTYCKKNEKGRWIMK